VTEQKLSMIERAENVLRDFGFHDVRVRHHELRANASTSPQVTMHLARIEVGPKELSRFVENGLSIQVADQLKRIGYHHVTLDLQGYRRGSANEALTNSVEKTSG